MKRAVITIWMFFFMCLLWPITARANQTGVLMTAQGKVEVKATPSSSSETIVTYADGEAVFVVGEKNGWYAVLYQGKTGYVPKSDLRKINLGDVTEQADADNSVGKSAGDAQVPEEEDTLGIFGGQAGYQAAFWGEKESLEDAGHQAFIDALNEEFAAMEAESQILVNEVERQREEKKSATVWAVLIGVLVVGIFVTGLISSSGSKKKEEQSRMDIIDLDTED